MKLNTLVFIVSVCSPATLLADMQPSLTMYWGYVWNMPQHDCVHQNCADNSCYKVFITNNYNNTVGLSMTDSIVLCDPSAVLYTATHPKEVSTVPPAESPEPAKPAAIPVTSWYEAILPSPVRIRRA